ncbi:substrate-binding domain-containing protein [uncultured Hyphomonas sp.]|uniref:substrate-binding domain-containing protein n=1 Tax=uncultured Hyphomonas sp. TaxID=225298 RepID=UPI002AAB8E48|nr:substrate-binding domain-containing protein [uncultured Hyphomonas sp.]
MTRALSPFLVPILAAAVLMLSAACGRTDLSELEVGDRIVTPTITGVEAQKIKIVGSSTVSPFATAVAEQFGAVTEWPTPIVETTGTGGGFKAFCLGTGPSQPSISDASRPIKAGELALCAANGVNNPAEIRVGYDGIVIANSKAGPDFDITKAELYRALAMELPDGEGGFVTNPYKSWNEVSPTLPDEPILVFGPPPTSGTRDAFVELGMELGALDDPQMAALSDEDETAFLQRARTIRTDGAWIDFGENDAAVVQALTKTPTAIGILGFSFLEQNSDRVKAGRLSGISPDFVHIKDGAYGLSRMLFIYVKRENLGVVPGIAEFVEEFVSDGAMGTDGYLLDKGLIPLTDEDRAAEQVKAADLNAEPKD